MEKLKINRNISKKFISLTLTSVIAISSLVGCSNALQSRDHYFKGTNLKNVNVIFFADNTIDIANNSSYCSPRICSDKHNVYKSFIKGDMFTDDDCNVGYSADYLGTKLNKYSIVKTESIISYLTDEELAKANKNELTEEDISIIIARIFESEKNIEKTKKAD